MLGPKPSVLPLHHGSILKCECKYTIFFYYKNKTALFFSENLSISKKHILKLSKTVIKQKSRILIFNENSALVPPTGEISNLSEDAEMIEKLYNLLRKDLK